MAKKVAINGFGRIGRALFKQLLEVEDIEVAAVNDLVPADNLAYLLKYDTVYGRYPHEVTSEKGKIYVDGKEYPILAEKDPAALPWKNMAIDIVFECTGVFTTREGLEKHIKAGAKHAILSAPSKSDDVDTLVYGVNVLRGDPTIYSCASCTTNAISPVVEILGRRVGFSKALMTTVHAYTASQGIVDGPAKKWRRGRAGAENLVPTSTGAAIATTKALPEYKGKFDGVAVRAPVPVGSIADLVFVTSRKTTVEELNNMFREEARTDRYSDVLAVAEDPIVSSDIIGDYHASTVDLSMTQVVDGNLVKVMTWYDNEWGYTAQLVRQAMEVLGAEHPRTHKEAEHGRERKVRSMV
jgi:glyceraldehyde 3-phosphate dehydrogenase